jgi:hypothetical protein
MISERDLHKEHLDSAIQLSTSKVPHLPQFSEQCLGKALLIQFKNCVSLITNFIEIWNAWNQIWDHYRRRRRVAIPFFSFHIRCKSSAKNLPINLGNRWYYLGIVKLIFFSLGYFLVSWPADFEIAVR